MKSPEALFLRYREHGDAAALGALFDQLAPELLAIASHVARGLDEAEDLVGATFLAAIERAEAYDAARPLVPWLVGILVNLSHTRRRAAARVPDVERLAPRVERAPEELLVARELDDALSRALAGLSSPYREVLTAHLVDGKQPREIAADIARAPGTVRVQLHRGLDLLRAALPASLGAGLALHALPTRGLAAVRAGVLAAARPEPGPAVASAIESSRRSAGALAELTGAKGLVLAALVVAAAVVVGLFVHEDTPAGRPVERALVATHEFELADDRESTVLVAPAARRAPRASDTAALAAPEAARPDTRPELEPVTPVVAPDAGKVLSFVALVRAHAFDPPFELAHLPGDVRVGARLDEDRLSELTSVHGSLQLGGELELDLGRLLVDGALPPSLTFWYDHPGLQPMERRMTLVEAGLEFEDGRRSHAKVTLEVAAQAPTLVLEGSRHGAATVALLVHPLGERRAQAGPALVVDVDTGRGPFRLRAPTYADYAVAWLWPDRPVAWVEVPLGGDGTSVVADRRVSVELPSAPEPATLEIHLRGDGAGSEAPVRVRAFEPGYVEQVAQLPILAEVSRLHLAWREAPRERGHSRGWQQVVRQGLRSTIKTRGLELVRGMQELALEPGRSGTCAALSSDRVLTSVELPILPGEFTAPTASTVGRSPGQVLSLELPLTFLAIEAEPGSGQEPRGLGPVLLTADLPAAALLGGRDVRWSSEVELNGHGVAAALAPAGTLVRITMPGARAVEVTGRAQEPEVVRLKLDPPPAVTQRAQR